VTETDTQSAFERPLALYILLRLLLALGLLLLVTLPLRSHPAQLAELADEFLLAALIFGVMGVSASGLPRFGAAPWYRWLQLFIDTIFSTALVALTDGPVSPFFPLYFLNILAGAWLLPSGGAVAVAGLNTAAFSMLLAYRGLPWLEVVLGERGLLLYTQVLVQIFAFFLVGLLANLLVAKVQQARLALAQQVAQTQQLQERHSLVLEQLDTGVLITDSDGVILAANPSASRIIGPVSRRLVSEVFRLDGTRWEQPFDRGGERLTIQCSRGVMDDGAQVILVEDVTRLREMETAVARDERLAAVGRFAAGLAHEIRNPLASLSGSVQLLKDDGESPLHDIVLREVKRLNELVEEFLDSARPVALDPRWVEPAQIIDDVATAFRTDARFRGRRVVRTRAVGLPRCWMDGGRFRQVLWNLVLNAAQATADYGTIEISGELLEGDLLITVSDDGVGIEPPRLARIFDPFYTTRSGGTGLGLANVDRIVRGHGGHITVDSIPGSGTRFKVRIPAQQRPEPITEVVRSVR